MSVQTEWVWSTTRDQIIEAFAGETPGVAVEQAVTAIFEQRPWAVDQAYGSVAAALQRGEITSGWAILRKRLEQAGAPSREIHVSGHQNREKLVQRAEQWMHATGLHLDRPSEVEDELFGDMRVHPQPTKNGATLEGSGRGILQPFANDPVLRKRMLDLWQQLRPTGEQLDREADERGRQTVENRVKAIEHRAAMLAAANRKQAEHAAGRTAA